MIRTKGVNSVRHAITVCCQQCIGAQDNVKSCDDTTCVLYKYRMGVGKIPSVLIIRKYCLICFGGSSDGVAECKSKCCSLRPFRFGCLPKAPDNTPMSRKNPPQLPQGE